MQNEIPKKSVAKWYDPFISVALLIATFFWLYKTNISDTYLVIYITLVLAVWMTTRELLTSHNLVSTSPRNFKEVLIKSFVKYLGVVFGMILILFMYWLIPEYQLVKYLEPINEAKFFVIMLVLILAFPMIFLSEYLLGHKDDGTYNMGLFATLQLEKINWKIFRDGILEWLIRLIFLTLNFTSAVKYIGDYRLDPLFVTKLNFTNFVISIEPIIFLIILIVILPGYLFSWRIINNDTKKIDSSWFAWSFLLICYQPFIGTIFNTTFKYTSELPATVGAPVWVYLTTSTFTSLYILQLILGTLILISFLMHLWGEAILGIRSSNISNKGIITNGPFRITKHPVYLFKIFAWFLISLPFFNALTALESLRLGLAFLFICAIYIGRCISEERLLASDKNYVEYALWMDNNSYFKFVGKLFPVMTFKWRYNYWKNAGQIK